MPATLDDFVTRTHLELAALSAQAGLVRRSISATHCCPATAPCKHCAALTHIHARIDDHLLQLEETPILTALDPSPAGVDCGMCGRRRYRSDATGSVACAGCDDLAGLGPWAPIPNPVGGES